MPKGLGWARLGIFAVATGPEFLSKISPIESNTSRATVIIEIYPYTHSFIPSAH